MKRLYLLLVVLLLLVTSCCIAGTEVARFEFEGNANDCSGNSNHGVVIGDGVSFVYDSVRKEHSAYFNGDSDSYILVSNEPNFDFISGVTITAWIKAGPQAIDWVNVISKFDSYDIVRHWNTNYLGSGISGVGSCSSGLSVFDNKWHFIAMTYDGSTITIYVDETSSSIAASGAMADSGYPLRVGGNSCASIQGYLDDVRVYGHGLTGEQINTVRREGIGGSCTEFEKDLNQDCVVDWSDLVIFAADWLADTYSENTFNLQDFAILADCWGNSITSIFGYSDTCYMENEHLKVEVNAEQGNVTVYDKDANYYRWEQPNVLGHGSFTQLETSPGQITFKTSMQDSLGANVDCQMRLVLPAGQKELQVYIAAVDPDSAFAGMDGFEPFQAPDTTGSYLAVTDWSCGHLYPTDIADWPLYNLENYSVDMLQLPWVGVVDIENGIGYSVTVATPYDATLRCIKFGERRAPLIRWRPEKGKMGYERGLVYNFTSTGGYVALAKNLRSYMQDLGYVKTLAEKALTKPDVSKLYGAVYLWDYFHCMNASEMYNLGVLRALHHVSSWDDLNNRQPSDAAGINSQKSLGWIVEEYQSYADAYACDESHPVPEVYYDIYPDNFMKDQNGGVMLGWEDALGQQYKRCPSVYVQRASECLPSRLNQYPMNGLYLDVTGIRNLDECWDSSHPMTRRDCQVGFSALMKYISDRPLVQSSENGKWWCVPFLDVPMGLMSVLNYPFVAYPEYYHQLDYDGDGINDTSLQDWDRYEICGSLGHKYRVPLWHLVFHDCTSSVWYPNDPIDITAKAEKSPQGTPFPFSYQNKKEAISILYGSVPTFTVIDPASSGGAWFDDKPTFMRIYRNVCKFHEIIADKDMVSHEFVTPDRDIQKTIWSDGTVVLVNFGSSDYVAVIDSTQYTLKQFGWVVSGSNYKASRSYDSELNKEITEILQPGIYYFNDIHGVPVAIRKISDELLRVNADDLGNPYSFKFYPKKVVPDWDINNTSVYICDKFTGNRLGKLPFSVNGDCIETITISGWAVLDVVCE